MLIDIHVHSSNTPGVTLTSKELVSQAKQQCLDGFCLTDVNTIKGGQEAKELGATDGILVLAGFEAYTDRGHFLVFVPEPEKLPEIPTWLRSGEQGRLAFASLVRAVEELSGILIAAHPFDRTLPESPGDSLLLLTGVSAVEVLNGSRPPMVNELAEELAAGVGLPGVAGSDARQNLTAMGKVATLVRGPLGCEADLIDRIRSYDVWPVSIGEPALSLALRRPRSSKPATNKDQAYRPGRPREDRREPRASRNRNTGGFSRRRDSAAKTSQETSGRHPRPRRKPSPTD